jgi:hypothetical protein
MKGTLASVTRPRRLARARFVMLGGALVVAAIVALAVHVPHSVSLSAASVTANAPAKAHPMTAGHLDHAEPASGPADATCATCGVDQDGAAFACALVLFVMAIMRLMPRATARVVAWVRRSWPVHRWPAVSPLPQAPSLHALCISRT